MDVYRLKNLTHGDRMAILEAENSGIEEQTYIKPLTNEEGLIIQAEVIQNMIKKGFMDDEFQRQREAYKDEVTPIKDAIAEGIDAMKTRSKTMTGKVFKLLDFENKAVHFVDADGNVINSRMMKPEERQLTISHNLDREAV